jgi:ethanolamine ammonia-lyase small subunit
MDKHVVVDPWQQFRQHTCARIALGRAGASLPTDEVLGFQLAHAMARDAVLAELDMEALTQEIRARGYEVIAVRSAAANRDVYLKRPDLGRKLDDDSREILAAAAGNSEYDAVFVVAGGLSAIAVQRHAVPLIKAVMSRLEDDDWRIAPIVIAAQARVALGDDIAAAMKAKIAVMMIGERPGLSSPDSLGVYLTFDPKPGRVDSERNCISNIRPGGLAYSVAAKKLHYLLSEARRLKLTGVGLKDESDIRELEARR